MEVGWGWVHSLLPGGEWLGRWTQIVLKAVQLDHLRWSIFTWSHLDLTLPHPLVNTLLLLFMLSVSSLVAHGAFFCLGQVSMQAQVNYLSGRQIVTTMIHPCHQVFQSIWVSRVPTCFYHLIDALTSLFLPVCLSMDPQYYQIILSQCHNE